MYFNMNWVDSSLRSFPESEYTISPISICSESKEVLIMVSDVNAIDDVKYFVLNQARRLNLSGLVSYVGHFKYRIIINGIKSDILLFLDELSENKNFYYKIEIFEVTNYEKSLVAGFYIT